MHVVSRLIQTEPIPPWYELQVSLSQFKDNVNVVAKGPQ